MTEPAAISFSRRTAIAIALTMGFWLLVIATSGVFFGVAYWLYRNYPSGSDQQSLAVGIVGLGFAIWIMAFPSLGRRRLPGARLEAKRHPELFGLLERCARAAGCELPDEIILTFDMNAFVLPRRGRFIGRGVVMGMGLPLMHVLTVPEFEAVVAHEFGHLHGGDHKLGLLVWQSGAAIRRSALLSLPGTGFLFDRYLRFFRFLIDGISRCEESAADRISAEIAGSDSAINSLKQIARFGKIHAEYYICDVAPLVRAGYMPPLLEGFAARLAAPFAAVAMEIALEERLAMTAGDPYDTHPVLTDRIAAMKDLPPCQNPDARPALSLLNDLPALELQIMASCRGVKKEALKPISWTEAEKMGRQGMLHTN